MVGSLPLQGSGWRGISNELSVFQRTKAELNRSLACIGCRLCGRSLILIPPQNFCELPKISRTFRMVTCMAGTVSRFATPSRPTGLPAAS